MDHNSVLRPLNALAEQTGLEPTFVPCDPQTGMVDPDDIRKAIKANTRLIAVAHVSNVTGTIQPVEAICKIAREGGVSVLVDAAQSIGHVSVDVAAWGADLVAFAGHKGALGPLGTGVLYVRPGFEAKLPTMKEGGTGTVSERAVQPDFMPDKYEIGSHNAIGLAGLSAAVGWLLEQGVDNLRLHDRKLCQVFAGEAMAISGLGVYGPTLADDRTGVFSVNVTGYLPQVLAAQLESRAGVLTRPGLHCAPLAHQTIGTLPEGTCRLSFGAFTTLQDVRTALAALREIAATPPPV
jgi:selenocysteine lyase/cysteine desulfurase